MWTRVVAQVGQEKASVNADMYGSPPIAETVEWRTPLDLNTEVAITDKYAITTTYSVAGCSACAGLYHLDLATAPLQLVENDTEGNPLAVQVTAPPDPPPVASDTDPAQPSEVLP